MIYFHAICNLTYTIKTIDPPFWSLFSNCEINTHDDDRKVQLPILQIAAHSGTTNRVIRLSILLEEPSSFLNDWGMATELENINS